jgi:hypothetical protein
MNKRIKKKRARLSPRRIGYNVYTAEEMKCIIKTTLLKHHLIPRIYFVSLYMTDPNKHSVFIWRKKNIKRALKYMYKHYVHLDMNHSPEVD